MKKKRVCIFTGGRAEYGILRPLLTEIKKNKCLELKLVVSGMHMSREFGLTYKIIEKDGFKCDEKIEMILSSDTPVAVSKSVGLGLISFSEAFNRIKPDILILLGDRFETFSAATAAMISRIPIAHIQGGEMTYGAIDDHFRHAITKMSQLHFVTTNDYKKRVIQLGEHPRNIFNVGALNVDSMKKVKVLKKSEVEKRIKISLQKKTILVTFHPITLEKETAENYFKNVIEALDDFRECNIIFTKTNADTEGRIINSLIDEYIIYNKNAVSFISMGQELYISSLRYVDLVLGNSSSGIIETPTFKVPTVNIGDREKGRIMAKNIINCNYTKTDIKKAISKGLSLDFKKKIKYMKSPYDNGETAKKICKIMQNYKIPNNTKKEFYNL